MRILIDATSLLLRSAGIKTYTYHWIQSLWQQAGNEQILTFPSISKFAALNHQRSILSPAQTYPKLALLYAANLLPVLPLLRWVTARVDVFHVSTQIWNPPGNTKLTATIHDMTGHLMPELHTAANVQAEATFAANVLRRADRLIAVSENTRADAVRLLGLSPERIEVIYSGIPEVYFGAQARPAARPYVLFIGTIEPRKNIDTLLDAWQGFRLNHDFELLIAGATGWASEKTLDRLTSRPPPGVRYLGYVAEDELPGLTAGATVFIYPSLYEGFGFPVAQAMAAGVPVITSNTSCLPEIAGDGALLVDPSSPAEIQSALEKLLTSPELRQQLGTAGRARAQQYRWETCARRSLEFFRRVG
ncbi:MAG TPA: glycosyltransferase family 1 protein [Bryobacteraceae bacterium]|jgi:glycosyltransferase involved in cell wall biosynthesis|nr:glycosyltransferase family 1 protein [Bryobacteraceae bacterium]